MCRAQLSALYDKKYLRAIYQQIKEYLTDIKEAFTKKAQKKHLILFMNQALYSISTYLRNLMA
jgi:hypothetical protein